MVNYHKNDMLFMCFVWNHNFPATLFFFFWPGHGHGYSRFWECWHNTLKKRCEILKINYQETLVTGKKAHMTVKGKLQEKRINTYYAQAIRIWNEHLLRLSERQHCVQLHTHLFSFNRRISEGPRSPDEGLHYTLERSPVYYSTHTHTLGASNPADVHVNGVRVET